MSFRGNYVQHGAGRSVAAGPRRGAANVDKSGSAVAVPPAATPLPIAFAPRIAIPGDNWWYAVLRFSALSPSPLPFLQHYHTRLTTSVSSNCTWVLYVPVCMGAGLVGWLEGGGW